MKHLYSLLCLTLCTVFLFCACAEPVPDEEAILGTWKITECIVDGEPLADMNDCFFTFRADGTGEKTIAGEFQFSYQYSFDGVTCVLFNLTYEDGTTEAGTYSEMTVKGSKMTVSAVENGVTEEVTLRRQKDA